MSNLIKTKDDALKALNDVDPEKVFYVSDGTLLHNIKELHSALKSMHPGTYAYHANPEKNDFSNWLNHVICDEKLAKDIIGKTQEDAEKLVSQRIAYLHKTAASKAAKKTAKKSFKK